MGTLLHFWCAQHFMPIDYTRLAIFLSKVKCNLYNMNETCWEVPHSLNWPYKIVQSPVAKLLESPTLCCQSAKGGEKHQKCSTSEECQYTELVYLLTLLFFVDELIMNVCQNGEWTLFSGYLGTPDYPGTFPASMHCTCSMSTKDGSAFSLRILDMQIPFHNTCRYDNI